jgi:membrane protease YdiL (CAAX protease family)
MIPEVAQKAASYPAGAIAWSALLLASPPIRALIARLVESDFKAQLIQALLVSGILLLLFLTARSGRLRLFVGVIVAWAIGYVIVAEVYSTSVWLNYRPQAPTYQWVMVDSIVQGIPTLFMLGLAVARGLRPADLFLVKGDLSARSSSGLSGGRPWKRLMLPIAILWAAISGFFLVLRLQGRPIATSHLAVALPVVVLFPILNALNEEVRFRNIFLGVGLPLFGSTSIVSMTAVFFGLAHFGSFFGTSGTGGSLASGLLYAAGAAVFGWILAKATLDTKGIVAAWFIHAISDLVLILGYVLTE